MTLTVMRAYFVKQTPKVVYYRDYKKFSNDLFRNDILQAQALTDTKENVQTTIVNIFNEHAPPQKRRYVRANQAPFMNKKLSKEIMTRSRLRNKFLKTKTDANRKAYNKQRNYCVSLFRREKKSFFNNLDTKKIVDNKRFWRTVKPFFSDKNRVKNKITLIEEKTKIVSNNNLIAETFNKFFANIVPSLGLQCKDELLASVEHIQDPLEKIIEKFKQHPSIIAIMKHRPNKSNFSFSRVAKRSIESLIKTLDSSKTIQKDNIPTKIIKENIDIMSNIFHEDINKCFSESFFPDDLKRAEVIPVFKKDIKKDSKTLKENYRPVSILSNISKIYETCLYNELSNYFEDIFSDYQFGFRKGISAQQCLIILIETWKKHIDNKESFGALLTDLSKAFDCVNHELLIAKLHAYGLDNSSLRLIHSYLNNRQQRVRIDNVEISKMEYLKDRY